MKWLETSPGDYDRGIHLLTLGRLPRVKGKIAKDFMQAGDRVLEIGCGTGALTVLMAEVGAHVTGIDSSPGMLAEAQKKIESETLEGRVDLKLMAASQIEDHFSPGSFDAIVATLVFSEIPPQEREYVLASCARLLASGGHLLIADEVVPPGFLRRLLYYAIRLPLAALTWLITRTTTTPLKAFPRTLAAAGFLPTQSHSYLGGSLVLYVAQPGGGVASLTSPAAIEGLPGGVVARLEHKSSLRTRLLDLWALFFRLIPPYPKVRTGLYALGNPTSDSPVLVTGNFDLTVRRLTAAIDGEVDAWVLVADSAGINVWCAAGGGYFSAEKVIAALKAAHLDEVVDHHALILPQLCANGVDGWKIRRETGWGVHWGPARAEDLPAYLAAGRKKSDAMRWVRFPLKDRLEMVTVTLAFYSLLILVPILIFWRHLFWPVTASLLGLSYFYALMLPWLPGRDGLQKSIPLTLIALAGLSLYAGLTGGLPAQRLFNWALGLTGLSVFTAAELQGMSPLMRGEQANWGWEAVIFAVLGLAYWLVPLATHWR
jgi:ubiquinone/menaquinone biosynthesis C-methylase UbiE